MHKKRLPIRKIIIILLAVCIGLFVYSMWQYQKMDRYVLEQTEDRLYWNFYYDRLCENLDYALNSEESIYTYLYADADQLARNFSFAGNKCIAYADAKKEYGHSKYIDGKTVLFTEDVREQIIRSWGNLKNGFAVFCEKISSLEYAGCSPKNDEETFEYLLNVKNIVSEIAERSKHYELPELIRTEHHVAAYLVFFEELSDVSEEFRSVVG